MAREDFKNYLECPLMLLLLILLTLTCPGFLVDLKARERLNQDALVFDVLYGYFSLKTCIHGLK